MFSWRRFNAGLVRWPEDKGAEETATPPSPHPSGGPTGAPTPGLRRAARASPVHGLALITSKRLLKPLPFQTSTVFPQVHDVVSARQPGARRYRGREGPSQTHPRVPGKGLRASGTGTPSCINLEALKLASKKNVRYKP